MTPDYAAARVHFCSLANALGCRLEEHAIAAKGPYGEELAINVAIMGEAHPKKVVVVSSGLHGVEGFFGSAVQCALLERLVDWSPPPGASLVLLHALNPYGFAWLRRCNENNIDLNRNFLLPGEEYKGSPERYCDFDALFNPTSPPKFELFFLKLIAPILRYGVTSLKDTLKNTLPVGQYDFPKGLFFGGNGPSKTQQILETNLPRWVGNATDILHIDFHTGLGQKATYKLFVYESTESERVQWLVENFGADVVETNSWRPGGSAYITRGTLGSWCKAKFPQCNYDFLTAEFGTYNMLRVLEALRAENRAYWWGQQDQPSSRWAKKRLLEVFAPTDRVWRETVVSQGLDLVQRAIETCFQK